MTARYKKQSIPILFSSRMTDTLRNENVALESERNPEFRRRVENEVARIRREMVSIHRIVSDARQPTAVHEMTA